MLLTVFQSFGTGGRQSEPLDYSTFLGLVETSQISEVTFQGDTIKGVLTSGERFVTYSPETDNTALIGELKKGNVQIKGDGAEGPEHTGQPVY